MSARQPSVSEVQSYLMWLQEQAVFNELQVAIDPNIALKSFELRGDWEYNDEGGTDFRTFEIIVTDEEGTITYCDRNCYEHVFENVYWELRELGNAQCQIVENSEAPSILRVIE